MNFRMVLKPHFRFEDKSTRIAFEFYSAVIVTYNIRRIGL